MTTNEQTAALLADHTLHEREYGRQYDPPGPAELHIGCACGVEYFSWVEIGADDFPDGLDPGALHSQHLAQVLDDAGLLMPDLPAPTDDGVWRDGWSEIFVDDEGLLIMRIDSRPAHPGRARRIAAKILAAADHAEKEGDHQ